MGVETDDVDPRFAAHHFLAKGFVGNPDPQAEVVLLQESAQDVLRCLLGELRARHLEFRSFHHSADKITAGDLTFTRLCGSAVEIPGRAQPAAHHFRHGVFQ